MRGTTTRVLVVATVVALAGALSPSATAGASGPTSPPPQTYMRLPGVVTLTVLRGRITAREGKTG